MTYSAETPSARRWTFLVFMLAFLTATVFLGNSLNPFAPPKQFVFRVFCLLFALLWVEELLLPERKTQTSTRADLPVFLFTMWSAASFLYAGSRILTLNSFLHLVCGVFVFFIVSRKITGTGQARKLLNLLLIVGLASTFFAVFDFLKIDIFPWDAMLENRLYSVWAGVKPNLGETLEWDYYFSGRVSSSFGNPVYVAGYLLMLLPVGVSLFLIERRAAVKIFYAFTTLALLLHLILTYTRFAWLCFPAGLLVLFAVPPPAATRKMLRRNLAWLAAGAVLFTLLAAPFFFRHPVTPGSFSISERMRSVLNLRDPSLMERLLIWKTAWEIAKEHPVIGVGLGNFEVYHPIYQPRFFHDRHWAEHTSFPHSTHNEYLEILCERGIVGLALFAWFLAAIFVPVWRFSRPGQRKPERD
ncbi:MAG: O-antigen ligase family protein, partial [bacterium]